MSQLSSKSLPNTCDVSRTDQLRAANASMCMFFPRNTHTKKPSLLHGAATHLPGDARHDDTPELQHCPHKLPPVETLMRNAPIAPEGESVQHIRSVLGHRGNHKMPAKDTFPDLR